MKRLPFALVLALAAGLGGTASAQQARPGPAGKPEASPAEAYLARKTANMVLIADKLTSPANFAWDNDLKQTAIEVYKQALEFDPENARAKERLGFEKKDGSWVANESKQKKLAEIEDGSKGEKKRGEFEKKLKDAQKEAAKLLAALGSLALAAGDDGGAQSHFKATLEFDDQNAVANEKSGNKMVDGKWYTGRALAHKEWVKLYKASLAKAQAMAVAPVNCDESSKIAEAAGIPIEKYKSKNFRIESNLTSAEIRDLLIWLERSRQFYIDLFDVPERMLDYSANPYCFILVRTKEQLEKLVDACPAIEPKSKSFMKKFTSMPGGEKLTMSIAENGEGAQPNVIHTATHSYAVDTFGRHSPWLYEAIANAVSAAIRNADLHVCFSGDGTTGGIHLERIDLEQAPTVLLELIRDKKDTPIGEFVKLPSDAMSAQMIAKSWSIVMFLMEMDRNQARDYFGTAGQGGDGEKSRDDKVLKQYFPDYESWSALDTAWREWAKDVYKR